SGGVVFMSSNGKSVGSGNNGHQKLEFHSAEDLLSFLGRNFSKGRDVKVYVVSDYDNTLALHQQPHEALAPQQKRCHILLPQPHNPLKSYTESERIEVDVTDGIAPRNGFLSSSHRQVFTEFTRLYGQSVAIVTAGNYPSVMAAIHG